MPPAEPSLGTHRSLRSTVLLSVVTFLEESPLKMVRNAEKTREKVKGTPKSCPSGKVAAPRGGKNKTYGEAGKCGKPHV